MTASDYTLLPGDCRQLMRLAMAPDSVDSIVTDPPYDLTSIVKRFGSPGAAPCQQGTDGAYARASRGFMGQTWDGQGVAFDPDTWREAFRVLKPGGHLIAFGGTRTYHRMACAIEDAGFEIRDQMQWIYGSGFPKSHNVAQSIEKKLTTGAARRPDRDLGGLPRDRFSGSTSGTLIADTGGAVPLTTAEAEQWNGWGTALKPAHEPIVLARKPLVGSVAANVLAHGTGALNIDGCRVETGTEDLSGIKAFGGMPEGAHGDGGFRRPWMNDRGAIAAKQEAAIAKMKALGRFPANVMHDGSDEVLAGFPANAGAAAPVKGTEPSDVTNGIYGKFAERLPGAFHGDSGSAARFFYCPKASKADREEGLDGLPLVAAGMVSETSGQHVTRRDEGYQQPQRANHHPTVKPTALMRYLVRLITPPGGTVLDPFAGSGSTGKAALLEGFSFIGCEMTPEYVPIAEARLAHALAQWRTTTQ